MIIPYIYWDSARGELCMGTSIFSRSCNILYTSSRFSWTYAIFFIFPLWAIFTLVQLFPNDNFADFCFDFILNSNPQLRKNIKITVSSFFRIRILLRTRTIWAWTGAHIFILSANYSFIQLFHWILEFFQQLFMLFSSTHL